MLSVVILDHPHALSDTQRKLQTMAELSPMNLELIFVPKSEAEFRAERLNIGLERSRGKIVLFVHPRSAPDPEGILHLMELAKSETSRRLWGGFRQHFDRDQWLLRWTSWYSNRIRFSFQGIVYLDHCIFFSRELWVSPLPSIPIFEDTILSHKFRKISSPVLLPWDSVTSSIRYDTNGTLWQFLKNQIAKLLFFAGVSPVTINRFYEKGLWLNGEKS